MLLRISSYRILSNISVRHARTLTLFIGQKMQVLLDISSPLGHPSDTLLACRLTIAILPKDHACADSLRRLHRDAHCKYKCVSPKETLKNMCGEGLKKSAH